ncbi:MAG TPA: MscL family protein, partial [Sedimentisphaerales bacterium]|nr:MscL family protein [Sedimentisphaerales bacterium]
LGGTDFKNLQLVLKEATVDPAGKAVDAVAVRYGLFINTVIGFLIVAFTIFMVIRIINRLSHLRGLPGSRGASDAPKA